MMPTSTLDARALADLRDGVRSILATAGCGGSSTTDTPTSGMVGGCWRLVWMDLPKAVRRQAITIGGEPVVELDYRAMMPRLLYAQMGNPTRPERDPYAIPGIQPKHRRGREEAVRIPHVRPIGTPKVAPRVPQAVS